LFVPFRSYFDSLVTVAKERYHRKEREGFYLVLLCDPFTLFASLAVEIAFRNSN
jgi:hypothetical protein